MRKSLLAIALVVLALGCSDEKIATSNTYTFTLEVEETAESGILKLEKNGVVIDLPLEKSSATSMQVITEIEDPGQWNATISVFSPAQTASTWYNNVIWDNPDNAKTLRRLELALQLNTGTTIELPSSIEAASNYEVFHYSKVGPIDNQVIEILYSDYLWNTFVEINTPEDVQLDYLYVDRSTYWMLLDGSGHQSQDAYEWTSCDNSNPLPNCVTVDGNHHFEFTFDKGDVLGQVACLNSLVYVAFTRDGQSLEAGNEFTLCIPE